jgi:hypothetical protein
MPSAPPASPASIDSLSLLSACSPASAVCSPGGWLELAGGWLELGGGWLELAGGWLELELGGVDGGGLEEGGVELGTLGGCGVDGVLALGQLLSNAAADSMSANMRSRLTMEYCLLCLVCIVFLYRLRSNWLAVDQFGSKLHALDFS